ncbi:outer membrane protein [Bradyrhizobium vignae]|uniref:outer membrane protein n=1 Tax=Bradyrhizobium vignae TaxID=1549949 RepID=UPI001ADD6EFB|nr:hypothetical protein [Bradyrhizobium vignae]
MKLAGSSIAGFGAPIIDTVALSGRAVHSGVVLGGGAEYALNSNWSIKGEYDYVRMMAQNFTLAGPFSETFRGSTLKSTIVTTNTVTQELNLFKLGVNYLFNPTAGL